MEDHSSAGTIRPGKRPPNSRRFTRNENRLPSSMVKELKEAEVFRAINIKFNDESAQVTIANIDIVARNYLCAYNGAHAKYPTAKKQKKIADDIARSAKRLGNQIKKDPEVSKRFFLALQKVADQEFMRILQKYGNELENKENYIQRLMESFIEAADIAKRRSHDEKGRPKEYPAEADLAAWLFIENPSIFKQYTRRKRDGRISLKQHGRELLEQLVRRIMRAALKKQPLIRPDNSENIQKQDVEYIASTAIASFTAEYGEYSHIWNQDDDDSDNGTSKTRWYS